MIKLDTNQLFPQKTCDKWILRILSKWVKALIKYTQYSIVYLINS